MIKLYKYLIMLVIFLSSNSFSMNNGNSSKRKGGSLSNPAKKKQRLGNTRRSVKAHRGLIFASQENTRENMKNVNETNEDKGFQLSTRRLGGPRRGNFRRRQQQQAQKLLNELKHSNLTPDIKDYPDRNIHEAIKMTLIKKKGQPMHEKGVEIGRGDMHVVFYANDNENEVIKLLHPLKFNGKGQKEEAIRSHIMDYYQLLEQEKNLNIYVARNTNNFFKDGYYRFEKFEDKFNLENEEDKNCIIDKFVEMIIDTNKLIPDFSAPNVRKGTNGEVVIIDPGPETEKDDIVELALDIARCLDTWLKGVSENIQNEFYAALYNLEGEMVEKILNASEYIGTEQ